MDLCGQCHANGIFRRTDLFSFQPGDDLTEHFRLHQNPNFEDDNVANQVKYLSMSKCFQNSDSMSCITCHSPHHVQNSAQQGHESCITCHQASDCHEQQNLPPDLQDRCAQCHMPSYSRLAVRFHTSSERYVFPVRSTQHRIGVYPEARDAALLEWYEAQPNTTSGTESSLISALRSDLIAHWLQQSNEYSKQDRFVAAIGAAREAARWDETQASDATLSELVEKQSSIDRNIAAMLRAHDQRDFEVAIRLGQKVLGLQPNHAITLGKIGTAYAALGEMAKAESFLKRSANADADNSYASNMLGWLAFLNGKFESAIDHFKMAEDIYPHTAENNYRWGLALNGAARWEEAAERLELALSINPTDANICLALCQAHRGLQQPEEALRYAYRAARLTEFSDIQSLEFLATEYRRSKRYDDAAAIIRRALANPDAREPTIQKRLNRQLQTIQLRHE